MQRSSMKRWRRPVLAAVFAALTTPALTAPARAAGDAGDTGEHDSRPHGGVLGDRLHQTTPLNRPRAGTRSSATLAIATAAIAITPIRTVDFDSITDTSWAVDHTQSACLRGHHTR